MLTSSFRRIGLVMGLAFLNPPSTPAGIQSFKTVTFFCQPGYFYLSIILAVFILCEELVVFDREREDNMYKTLPWVASTILSYLPMNAIIPTIYAIIVYFMTGWRRDNLAKNLFSFIAGCIMQQQAAWSLALLCSAVNRSFAQASLLANGQWLSFPFSALEPSLAHTPSFCRSQHPYSPFEWISYNAYLRLDRLDAVAFPILLRLPLASPPPIRRTASLPIFCGLEEHAR